MLKEIINEVFEKRVMIINLTKYYYDLDAVIDKKQEEQGKFEHIKIYFKRKTI